MWHPSLGISHWQTLSSNDLFHWALKRCRQQQQICFISGGCRRSGGVCLYSCDWCNTLLSFISHTLSIDTNAEDLILPGIILLFLPWDIFSQDDTPGVCTYELMPQSLPAAQQAEQECASVSTSMHFTARCTVNLQHKELWREEEEPADCVQHYKKKK